MSGSGDLLDLILIAAVVLFAFSGYRQGFVVGALGFAGFLGGGMLGTVVAPSLARAFTETPTSQSVVGLSLVLVAATLGQFAGTTLGAYVRRRLTHRHARRADAVGGALISATSVLLVAWLLAAPIAKSEFTGLRRQVRGSRVIATLYDALPPSDRVFSSFRRLLAQRGFPEVFANPFPGTQASVPPPDPAVLNSAAVKRSRDRVLKIIGVAKSCRRRLEGTGFVYANERVMTNAHVVAGVKDPEVEVNARTTLDATVVLFDPDRDVAVLHVPGLRLAPLGFAGVAKSGDSAVVAGYPEDGPFNAVAARVRERIAAVGRDIYGRRQVRRDVYAIRGTVRPGNSGGPLLAPDGRVYGVVFAASTDDPNTGYVLTAAEVRSDADRGARATAAVSTQGCD